MTPRREGAIDGLRGVAVLAVVAHHAALLPFAIGTRGVDLFFAISGFCLALPTMRALSAGKPFAFDRKRFALDRLLRIVPPYYVALAIYVALSLTAFGVPTSLGPPLHLEWLADALFVTSTAPSYNAAFWTLGVEAHWYVLFPALLVLFVRSKIGFALLATAFYAAYAWHSEIVDAGALPCFMLGIVAAQIHARGRSTSIAFVPAAAAALVCAIAFDRGDDHGDPLWHLAAVLVLLAGVGPLRAIFAWRPLAFVGTASYGIYLIHQPLVFWLATHGLTRPLAAAVAIAVGIAFWRGVEVPALAWRARVLQKKKAATSVAAFEPSVAPVSAEV